MVNTPDLHLTGLSIQSLHATFVLIESGHLLTKICLFLFGFTFYFFTKHTFLQKVLTKHTFLDFTCYGPCQRRVKACLSVLFCLALLFIYIYLDIVVILFWDSILRHSPKRPLPLHSFKSRQEKRVETTKYPSVTFNESVKLEARNQQLR